MAEFRDIAEARVLRSNDVGMRTISIIPSELSSHCCMKCNRLLIGIEADI